MRYLSSLNSKLLRMTGNCSLRHYFGWWILAFFAIMVFGLTGFIPLMLFIGFLLLIA